jgi:hypothetical protein
MIVSIAVWNRKKVITTVAIGVWVIEIAFLIQGKSPLPLPASDPETHANVVGGHWQPPRV